MIKDNILQEKKIQEVKRQEEEIQEEEIQKVENKNYWVKLENFIEDNRNTFFWIILVSGIIIIINQYSNQSNFQYGGQTSSPDATISAAGKDKDSNKRSKLNALTKAAQANRGKSYSATTTDEGVFGAANYAMSFKYQIGAMIQMVALTVFLLIVVIPPLSILIIAAVSFILLKPNLKSLFRL